MFESLQAAPADAILGLIAEFRDDPRRKKIDLGVGVYRNAAGATPVLDVVKKAEHRLLGTQTSKTYIGTAGDPAFNAAMQALAFGDAAVDDRLVTIQTPGGSASLRVAAGLLLRARKDTVVWVSDPTWNNHVPLLGGAGLTLKTYPYYDAETRTIGCDAMLDTLRAADKGDVVLLHACCHNPSGIDPTAEQWRAIGEVIVERELVPFIDMAYQGFGTDLNVDAFAARHLIGLVPELVLSTSCSKNFGLYRDRVGAMSILAKDSKTRDIVASQASSFVRTLYSLPPDHGAAVVSIILNDAELRAAWIVELDAMRDRLGGMRNLLQDALKVTAPGHDFSHLLRAKGMFCFLGISPQQVARIKQEFGVYMVGSSRINVAGITPDNVEYLAKSIAAVL
ncbi:MAG: aspartate/tyrosine/aromatic aminotransferase [Proteobacteria bacterium]|nr:aspartate/tyrosine/aromatic aminotransferase [Pseudomonadota bacterium]MDA1062860.1 aspartate/tyrosine/aromatic aminotransferase [Pseudomonadota bacterium]